MKLILRNVKVFCLKFRRRLKKNAWPVGNEFKIKQERLKEKLKDIW